VDMASAEDVWPTGGDINYPADQEATTIESADADDAAGDTGARSVRVTGLDANNKALSEVVEMDGTTPVTLVNEYKRITDLEVIEAGSSNANEGVISVKHSATVIATIPAGAGRMRAAMFTAPSDSVKYLLTRFYAAVVNGVNGSGTFNLFTRKSGGAWQLRAALGVYGNSKSSDQLELAIHLEGGEDVRVQAAAGADNTSVVAGFQIKSGSLAELGL
jgi:hypothetical protein